MAETKQVNIRMQADLRQQVAEYALNWGLSFTQAAHELLAASLDKSSERQLILRELAQITAERLAELDEGEAGQ